jgi:hypothetical protein
VMIWMERRPVQTKVTNGIRNLILCSLVFHLIPESYRLRSNSRYTIYGTVQESMMQKALSKRILPLINDEGPNYQPNDQNGI